jgi:hypothetical protein
MKSNGRLQERSHVLVQVRLDELIRKSTGVGKRDAEQIEAARRTSLAKGDAGIVERPPVPILKEFAPRTRIAPSC